MIRVDDYERTEGLGSTPSSDHEHISKIGVFSQDLQTAIANSFPRQRSPYTSVYVLLLRWAEDDLNVQAELTTLKHIFEKQYRFTTEQWDIPGRDSTQATRALQRKLYNFQDSHQCEDELLIVYYGGHGDPDRRGRSIWAANKKPDSPTLNWSSLQHLLETAIPHVLIILDCCHAANAARDTSDGTTKELLAACGREYPTLGNSDRSFTTALIEELRVFGNKPFTVAMLHSRLITMRWRLAYTPVYALLSEHGGHSIELAPQPRPAGFPDPPDPLDSEISFDTMGTSSPEGSIAADTRVLLAVSIADDAICNVVEWKEWLLSQAPWDVTKIEVKVEAVFKSHSTMLITSLPTVAWDLLPDKAAYRFIGFVTSSNLSQEPLCSNDANLELSLNVRKQEQKLLSVKARLQVLEIATLTAKIAQGNHITEEAWVDFRNKLGLLKSNIRKQEEEITIIREMFVLRNQRWDKEKRGLEQRLHLAEERLKVFQGPVDSEVKSDTTQKDSSGMKTGAEPKFGPTESSNSQEPKPGCAGSVPSMKAQELARPLSYELGVDDIESIAKPIVPQSAANAIYPTQENSSRSFQDDATLQPENLDANRSHAAVSEDAAQTRTQPRNRKRAYSETGLSPPGSRRKARGASSHEAEEANYVIKCICGFHDDDGNTIQCGDCDTWQHIECYYPTDSWRLTVIDHSCLNCVHRQLNVRGAMERQRLRLFTSQKGKTTVPLASRPSGSLPTLNPFETTTGMTDLEAQRGFEQPVWAPQPYAGRSHPSMMDQDLSQHLQPTLPDDHEPFSGSSGLHGSISLEAPGLVYYPASPSSIYPAYRSEGEATLLQQRWKKPTEWAWDESRVIRLAEQYMQSRESTWKSLAYILDEDWAMIEAKCFEIGLFKDRANI
ncbi:MAG: hypothetical protein Q9199_004924 [Rusavskia elegans]